MNEFNNQILFSKVFYFFRFLRSFWEIDHRTSMTNDTACAHDVMNE